MKNKICPFCQNEMSLKKKIVTTEPYGDGKESVWIFTNTVYYCEKCGFSANFHLGKTEKVVKQE